jgi:hypothetical protein
MKKITESQLQNKVTSLRERLKMFEKTADAPIVATDGMGKQWTQAEIDAANSKEKRGDNWVGRDVPQGFKKQFPTELDIPNKYRQMAPGSDITNVPKQVAPVAPKPVAVPGAGELDSDALNKNQQVTVNGVAVPRTPTAPTNPSVAGASGTATAPTAQTPPVSAKPWAAPKELQDLADKNGIKITPDGRAMIKPGQEITLADGSKYTVAAGDNLWNIWKGKYKGAQPKPAEDPIAAQIEKDKGNVQNTPQVNHGPSTDEEGNLYPGWSRDENNNPVWVGDQDGKTFVEPATQALADKARQDAANKVAPVQKPDGQGTQTSPAPVAPAPVAPAPVAPAPARPTNTVQGGWTDSSGNPVTSGNGQQVGSGSTPAVIDYTKPDPKPTKDSLGQTCEYGVPVDKDGNFIPPNKALPQAEYQKQLEAYNTWKKDYLKRWPNATFDPNTGKANNGIKPLGSTPPVTTPQGTFTPKDSGMSAPDSVTVDINGKQQKLMKAPDGFYYIPGETTPRAPDGVSDIRNPRVNAAQEALKGKPPFPAGKPYAGTPSISNMAETVGYSEDQALARIIQLARI